LAAAPAGNPALRGSRCVARGRVGIYAPILTERSVERYGLIGIAFTFQSWLLVFAFVIVLGAAACAAVIEACARERV
jgi:uncharacterized BrkB/YihY/UPF0761 family membrane protein